MNNIVLVEPEIPQNTGNIMRTCVATNSKLHIIRPISFSLDDSHLKRSGVNYIDKLDLTIYDDIDDFFSKNKGEYYFLTRYGHKPHSSFDYSDPTKNYYFFFGKESTGLDKALLKEHLNHCLRIPMSNNVRALNVSNTVAIMVYEALRQQNYPELYFDEPHKTKTEIEDYIEKD
jgi:tRNA (cytidine/uridine-2'-O-)-methyltransferase